MKNINPTSRNRMDNKRKEAFFAELASLLSSGLDFARSFRLVIDSQSTEASRALMQSLFDNVVNGLLLWQSMERSGNFSNLDIGVIKIGETTGRIEQALLFLSDYYHKKTSQQRMVQSALSYPIIVLSFALIVVSFMLLVVVPMFEEVYNRMGAELPAITRTIISVSQAAPVFFTVLLLVVILTVGLIYHFRKTVIVRSTLALFVLAIPLIGPTVRKNIQANFCKLLFLTLSSGVSVLASLDMIAGIITFYPYEQSFISIYRAIEHGEFLSSNLTKYPKLYDKKLTTLLSIGEQTNRLPDMLSKYADTLNRELEFRIKQLGSILEPILILLIGCLVAVVLISMYMPMFRLGSIVE